MRRLLSERRFHFFLAVFLFTAIAILLSRKHIAHATTAPFQATSPEPGPPLKKYRPTPAFVPPPIKEPFPLLATSTPPPIPKWNIPRKDVHKTYNLTIAPPLLIGFGRTWPILLQAVVSYITAGWPPSQIYVVENTGTHNANAQGKLTLQNPFFLNHTILKDVLGVNIIQTPVLLSFAQLQNFYLDLSYANKWPYFFWSHQDVLALSYEDGNEHTPPYTSPEYKSIYELCLLSVSRAQAQNPRWAMRFFAYDHLTAVNPRAWEDVGGWDTWIPYYMGDCDMHSRLAMAGWEIKDEAAGIVTDVGTVLDDLRALYRVEGVKPSFTDPNPKAPDPLPEEEMPKLARRVARGGKGIPDVQNGTEDLKRQEDPNLAYWISLRETSNSMFHFKNSNSRGRNTWQSGQHGGTHEPFHYDSDGFSAAFEIISEAGKEVFRQKWGHRDCNLIGGAGLKLGDEWKVEKDWE
jgi:hypothetical protein